MKVKWRGIIFDDVIKGDYGYWTTICGECVKKLNISEKYLDESGIGACGVEDCDHGNEYCNENKILQFYLDFPTDEIEIMEE